LSVCAGTISAEEDDEGMSAGRSSGEEIGFPSS
jgi:hypothetical protein